MVVKEKKEVKKTEKEKVGKNAKAKKETPKSKKVAFKKESRIKNWFKGVVSEFKKVRWPSKKEMIKYSIATIVFILFFAVFFYIIELVIYFINQVK